MPPADRPEQPERPLRSGLHLNGGGRALLTAGAAFAAAGVLARAWPLACWGVLLLGLLLLDRWAAERLVDALRDGRLRVGLARRPRPRRPALAVDQLHPLELRLTNLQGAPRHGRVTLRTSAGLESVLATDGPSGPGPEGTGLPPPHLDRSAARPVRLPVGHHRSDWPVVCRWPGEHALCGVSLQVASTLGLCEAEAYWPVEQRLLVLDGDGPPHPPRPSSAVRPLPERGGAHRLRLAGLGSEFRELREHQPGDPFRSIEWKATARQGKLMVREIESEVVMTLTVLLDISPSMRQGGRRHSPLATARTLLHGLGHAGQAARDRLGLMTYDARIYGDLPASADPGQPRRLGTHLARLNEIVDEDLAPLDPDELQRHVGAALAARLGIELAPAAGPRRADPPAAGELADPGLLAVLATALARLPPPDRHGLRWPEPARDLRQSRLRLLCSALALPLPYRPRELPGDWATGLAAALGRVAGRSRGGHQLLVLSDLAGEAEGREELARSLRLVRSRGLRLTVVQLPRHVAAEPVAGAVLPTRDGRDQLRTLLAEDLARHGHPAELLGGLGVPVLRLPAGLTGEDLYRLLQRRQTQALPRRGR